MKMLLSEERREERNSQSCSLQETTTTKLSRARLASRYPKTGGGVIARLTHQSHLTKLILRFIQSPPRRLERGSIGLELLDMLFSPSPESLLRSTILLCSGFLTPRTASPAVSNFRTSYEDVRDIDITTHAGSFTILPRFRPPPSPSVPPLPVPSSWPTS